MASFSCSVIAAKIRLWVPGRPSHRGEAATTGAGDAEVLHELPWKANEPKCRCLTSGITGPNMAASRQASRRPPRRTT